MKINISSKTVSVIISFLVFLAIGVLSIALIGKGNKEDNISFDIYSDVEYSEHEGWTDISGVLDGDDESDNSSSNGEKPEVFLSAEEIASLINSRYDCNGSLTEKQFSDEMGIKIDKISFLDGFTPENVSYSLGYIFAGDKVFSAVGTELTETVKGYKFVGGRDGNGYALFENSGKYFYLKDESFFESNNTNRIVNGTSYMACYDPEYILFNSGNYWGAKDRNGEVVVKASYTYGYGFSEGVGCFATKEKVLYFINTKGKSISTVYKVPESGYGALKIQNGITLVSDGNKNLIMKSSGAILDTPADYKVLGCSDGMILLEKNGKSGYMNNGGEWVVSPTLYSKSFYQEGLATVSEKGMYVIDKNGNTVIPKGFDYISDFSDGCCILYSQNSGWYMAKKCYK
jgi:hypothetical protein